MGIEELKFSVDGQNSLAEFNRIYKELDVFYHDYARSFGLSDTAFWILYCIAERSEPFTQRDLCLDWSFAPQTINTALKEMEKRGLVYLASVENNKKNKWVKLTAEGERAIYKVVEPLARAEKEALGDLTEVERSYMLAATERYASLLKGKAADIAKSNLFDE